jgi:hypothetical protein
MTVRYHDGRGWSDSFDSDEVGALPVAIEVALWFHRWDWEPASGSATEAGGFDADAMALDDPAEEQTNADEEGIGVTREPDRVRVIAIPDGGVEETG